MEKIGERGKYMQKETTDEMGIYAGKTKPFHNYGW
jgi:hypothetical protein